MGYFQRTTLSNPLFELGRTVASRGMTILITEHVIDPVDYLSRHHHGDWGDVCEEDKSANDNALREGTRIVSKFHVPIPGGDPVPIYIITEADRSCTTLLLTSEY